MTGDWAKIKGNVNLMNKEVQWDPRGTHLRDLRGFDLGTSLPKIIDDMKVVGKIHLELLLCLMRDL